MRTLYDECLDALNGNYELLPKKEDQQLSEIIEKLFPTMLMGNIDWEKVIHKKKIIKVQDMLDVFNESELVIIFWDNGGDRALITTLKSFINALNEVTIVSFDTYVFFPQYKCLIEFYHDGTITMGYSNETIKQ